jgi:hypothetical protein
MKNLMMCMMNDYPADWPEIAEKIKNEAGWRCEHCDHPHHPPSGHTLTTHHLDGDKANCSYGNLVALCQRCHLSIQAKYHPAQGFGWFATPPAWAVRRGLA